MTPELIVLQGIVVVVAVLYLQRRRERRHGAHSRNLPPPDPTVLAIRGSDFYVRIDAARSAAMLSGLGAAVGDRGVVYPRGPWAVVLWSDWMPPEDLLRELSRLLRTDVIWLAFQKQVDAFEFQRWTDGVLKRRLAFGCYEKERTWEHVAGPPEPWEAAAFEAPPVVDSDEPSIDGRDAAEAVAVAYGLPGWE